MKTNRIILAALFISAAVSCQKESFAGLENPRETESATIVAGEPTKTSLSGNEVHWTFDGKSDDVIAVFDNFGYKNIFNITQAEGSYASFSGEVTSGTEQIYAVYPESLAESVSGSSIKVNVPVDQTSKVSSFAEEHNISVAKGTKTPGVETIENITFKNVCSYLKFTIPTYIEDAKSVTFSTSRAIAGPATVDASADVPVATAAETASKSVTMTGSYPAGSQFMFVLTPGTIQGFTVTVVTDKATWTITRDSEVSFAPGQYKNLGTLELEQVGVSAIATHTYSGSTLTGTTVNVALNVPTATLQYASDLKIEVRNAAGTVVRSASSSTLTSSETLAATQDWPYLPQGTYTVSGSYTLADGTVKTISDVEFTSPEPTFKVTSGAYSSYTKYKNGDAGAANKCTADKIYAITTASVSIADAILNNSNYSSIKGEYTYKLDGKAIDSAEVEGQSWGAHTVTAYYKFDNVTKEGSSDCHVTGLPRSFDFFDNESGASGSGWSLNNVTWDTGTSGYKCSIFSNGTNGNMISPKFNLPGDVNIECSVEAQYYVALTTASSHTAALRVGITNSQTKVADSYTTHTVNGDNSTGKDFSTYDTSLTITTSNPYVSLHHNSPSQPTRKVLLTTVKAAWWYLNVGVITINYR